jgi:hypothetical protein
VDAGEGIYYLVEGTHRANAAVELGLHVVLELIEYDWAEADQDMRLCDWIPDLDCDSTIGSVIGAGATDERCVYVEVEV